MAGQECSIGSRGYRAPDNEENAKDCACPMCPTYGECMKGGNEMLYCARGPSACKVVRRGCVCGQCNVAVRHALSLNYYCEEGPAPY